MSIAVIGLPSRRGGFVQPLAAAVLVLAVLGGYLLFTGPRAADQESSRLYLLEDAERQLRELDPDTLATLAGTPITLPVPPSSGLVDGSTIETDVIGQ